MSTRSKTQRMRPQEHRRRIRKGRASQERRTARLGVSLRGAGISGKTEARYNSALALVLPFIEQAQHLEDLDLICEEWIEYEWIKGTSLGSIGDALCGLHYFWPQVKGMLRGSWKLYKNWRRLEIPQRAAPLPRFVALGFVGLFLEWNEPTMAFLVALGFHTYLRTGEILRLQVQDILLDQHHGVATIRDGKTGLRFNIDESVAITDHSLYRLWELCHLPRPRRPHEPLWPHSGQAFRNLFYKAVSFFHLADLKLQPYSIRRGGFTYHFHCEKDLSAILLRGRWRALGVARLYLEDGLAQMTQLRMTQQSKSLIIRFSRGLPPSLLA